MVTAETMGMGAKTPKAGISSVFPAQVTEGLRSMYTWDYLTNFRLIIIITIEISL